MVVRLSADWMVKVDDRILEFLDTEGPYSPGPMAEDSRMPFSRKHLNMRLLKLKDAGLVQKEPMGRGVYGLTKNGREYLRGEFDARGIEKPE